MNINILLLPILVSLLLGCDQVTKFSLKSKKGNSDSQSTLPINDGAETTTGETDNPNAENAEPTADTESDTDIDENAENEDQESSEAESAAMESNELAVSEVDQLINDKCLSQVEAGINHFRVNTNAVVYVCKIFQNIFRSPGYCKII